MRADSRPLPHWGPAPVSVRPRPGTQFQQQVHLFTVHKCARLRDVVDAAAAPTALVIKPASAPSPMCAFISKCPWFPLLVGESPGGAHRGWTRSR